MSDRIVNIIQNEKRFALLKQDDGSFVFPKGLVEFGEELKSAARRESKDTLGFETCNFVYMGLSTSEGAHYFLSDYKSGETKQVEWKTADEILQMTGGKIFAPVATYLKRFLIRQPELKVG